MRRLLITLLLASPLLGQAPNGWAPIENGWAEIQTTAPTGTVTTTGTLASGQVALGSGATSITGDAGCTWTGTGSSFVATFGGGVSSKKLELTAGAAIPMLGLYTDGAFAIFGSTGVFRPFAIYATYAAFGADGKLVWTLGANNPMTTPDVALSRASAGTLLVEDGAGAARDVRARFLYIPGDLVRYGGDGVLMTSNSSYLRWGVGSYGGIGSLELTNPSVGRLSVGDTTTVANEGGDVGARIGYFGTSLYSPLFSGAPPATGTNVAGTTTTVAGQLGTGSGASGDQVFTVGTPQASGTGQHVAATALTLHNAGTAGTAAPQVIAGGVVRLAGYTVATLPAGTVGDTAYCTDLTAPTFMAVAVGGGAVVGKVFYDGTNWITQ